MACNNAGASFPRDVSGKQFREAISARSNFGLGFALTHILIKSDESHRRKSISPKIHLTVNIICTFQLGIDIELIVLSYLDCNSGRYLSFLAFCAFSVLTQGLPALVVCLAGTIDAGRSPKNPSDSNPRIKRTEEEEGHWGLPKANVIVVPLWFSPCRPRIAPGGILGINLTPLLSLGVVVLFFFFWKLILPSQSFLWQQELNLLILA